MNNHLTPDDLGFRHFTDEEFKQYSYWFEFLKQSDRAKWSQEVQERFGDIPDSLTFKEWWPDHKYLFHKSDEFTVDVIQHEADLVGEYMTEDGKLGDNPDIIGLVVNLYAKKQDLKAAFEKIINKYHKGPRLFTDFDGGGDVYDFAQKPNVNMLEKILSVHKAVRGNADNKTYWKIEEDLQLIDRMAANLMRMDDNDPMHIENRRRSQATTVMKYYQYAHEILEHVVDGKFPVYTCT